MELSPYRNRCIQDPNKDPLGQALLDYYYQGKAKDIQVQSDLADDDIIQVAYLFRPWEEMPEWEQKALAACKGKILEIGAGAGTHGRILKLMKKDISLIDISPGAVKVMQLQHLAQARQRDIFHLNQEKYDTLLLLMNGIGIVETIKGLHIFLEHAKSLLNSGGQIIFDSSDLMYLYPSIQEIEAQKRYYGEVVYVMKYKNIFSQAFGWLYIDMEMLSQIAKEHAYRIEILHEGPHHEYLARLELR